MTGAERMRRHRARRAAGRAVLRVEVDLVELVPALVEARLLGLWDESDRGAVERATERALAIIARRIDRDA